MPRPRKRQRNQTPNLEELDILPVVNHQNCAPDIVIDDLPDALLISILSRLNLKEAARASLLSRRWRYLWTFTTGILDFDQGDTASTRYQFEAVIDHVLILHQASHVDTFSVTFRLVEPSSGYLDKLICYGMKKHPKKLVIKVAENHGCEFPSLYSFLTPPSYSVRSAFGSLKSLELVLVQINDEMVHYFLASCMNLECLIISGSLSITNLRFVDPLPKMKVLEVTLCRNLKSLEISVASLVSCTFYKEFVDFSLKNVPNLFEVELGGRFCESFLFEANKHRSYSSQVKQLSLHHPLEMHGSYYYFPDLPQYESLKSLSINVAAATEVGRSLLFFTTLIKITYELEPQRYYTVDPSKLFPNVTEAEAPIFHHGNLKLVRLSGYIGCLSQDNFLTHIFKIAPSLENVFILTGLNYVNDVLGSKCPRYTYAKSRFEAKRFAERLSSKIPSDAKLYILD